MEALDTVITPTEALFIHYIKGMAGGGYTALIDAILKLDVPNRQKIALGFPELVTVCNRYQNEPGYWENLVKKHSK